MSRFLAVFSLSILLSGCSMYSPKLSGEANVATLADDGYVDQTQIDPMFEENTRRIDDEFGRVEVIPASKPFFKAMALKVEYQTKKSATAMRYSLDELGGRCLLVFTRSREPDAAQLKYLHLTARTTYGTVPLELRIDGEVEKSTRLDSHTSPGYLIGNTYFAGSTSVYETHTYTATGYYCAEKPLNFDHGLSVRVERRYQAGIPATTLRWSIGGTQTAQQ